MSRILVVWFSRTGITRGVAERLVRSLGAQACPLTERRSRLGPIGYLRSVWEASTGRDASIEPIACDPRAADLVVIGTPIWGWHLSSPVRAFVRGHASEIRRAAFFCTMGGAGDAQAFGELERLLGRAPVATLALADREIDRPAGAARIDAFVAALKQAQP
ncbi:MAG TPA: flavodoxin [Ideonella sp.]|nr:flavodoxin [Ideonella sp.]